VLAELKRRRVFRTAAGYGAVAFVVLQVVELLADGLQLPPIFLTAFTILALLGFPLALVLALCEGAACQVRTGLCEQTRLKSGSHTS
jgi:hypothetical protein